MGRRIVKRHHIILRIGNVLYERLREAADVNCVSLPHEIRRRLLDSFHNIDDATLSVPQAGKRFLGLGRNASYNAAARGDIPTIKVGKKIRVSVSAMRQMIDRP